MKTIAVALHALEAIQKEEGVAFCCDDALLKSCDITMQRTAIGRITDDGPSPFHVGKPARWNLRG